MKPIMIYILELERPMHHAKYYLGFCESEATFPNRLHQHQTGTGAKMLAAAAARGIGWRVVITLPGDRRKERQLKRQKNTPRLVQQFLKQGYGVADKSVLH